MRYSGTSLSCGYVSQWYLKAVSHEVTVTTGKSLTNIETVASCLAMGLIWETLDLMQSTLTNMGRFGNPTQVEQDAQGIEWVQPKQTASGMAGKVVPAKKLARFGIFP